MSPINRWINLHNIHACLYFGFSQNNLNRQSKLTKYVGNRHVSIKKGKSLTHKRRKHTFCKFIFPRT